MPEAVGDRERLNLARYRGGQDGHYESYFVRANHPSRALAFWLRYTLFSPKGAAERAIGELWAIVFDGETGRHLALKREFPLHDCIFSRTKFHVRIGAAELTPAHVVGGMDAGGHRIAWSLAYEGDAAPILLLPRRSYAGTFPAAKALVGLPLARFAGSLTLDGAAIDVTGWVGSQNHNWGSRHTDRYAWGQVAGFDAAPDSFLEVATARLRLGPLWLPAFTPMVLRHGGREHALTGILRSLRARGTFDYFRWHFAAETPEVAIHGRIEAPREAFVGLRYANPPGGVKHCLNTKIAACSLLLTDRRRGTTETLTARHRAAFEILTDDASHGVPIVA
jgi:hypothetical protein